MRAVVGGRLVMWSVVGGRCFAFLLVGGWFLFLRMVGGRCLNQYMVRGRWLMVGGLWSVAGRWAVVLYYAQDQGAYGNLVQELRLHDRKYFYR